MRWLLAMLALASCGGTAPPARTPVAAPEPSAPADALVMTTPPVVAEPAPSLPVGPSPSPPPIASACRGARLDLPALVAGGACTVAAPAQPVPDSIRVALTPSPVKVKSGGARRVALVLTNTSPVEVALYLREGCGALTHVTYELVDGAGRRVDLEEGGCGTGHGCAPVTLGVALPPGGQLRLEHDIIARMERFGAFCRGPQRTKPVPRGRYELRLYAGVANATTSIDVH